jgi:CDP-diacylglycerol--serine O-phosphatidyltransferase
MISRVRFRSFKDLRVTRKSLAVVFLIIVGSVIITMKLRASFIFVALMSAYLALGLTEEVYLYAAERRRKRREALQGAGGDFASDHDEEPEVDDADVLRELGADADQDIEQDEDLRAEAPSLEQNEQQREQGVQAPPACEGERKSRTG